MSILEIAEWQVCRIHRFADLKFPKANMKLLSLISPSLLKSDMGVYTHVALKEILATRRFALPVCERCLEDLRQVSKLRKEMRSDYPCLLDLELLEPISPSTTKYVPMDGISYPPEFDTKMQWKDFLMMVKRRYYSKTPIKEVSRLLREKMGVTQDMILYDMAWFSEEDYANMIRKMK